MQAFGTACFAGALKELQLDFGSSFGLLQLSLLRGSEDKGNGFESLIPIPN